MTPDKIHLRHVMLFQFNQGKNATQAAKEISFVYGEGAVSARDCQKWFARFRDGNFNLDDEERSSRPQELETTKLEKLLDEDPRQSSRELAVMLGVEHTTVLRHLHTLGKINIIGKWVPHKLSENNINQRLTICISLLAKHKKKDFLWKLVTNGFIENGFIMIIRKTKTMVESWPNIDSNSKT